MSRSIAAGPRRRAARAALPVLAAAVLGAGWLAAGLHAQERLAVGVHCTLSSSALRAFYGPEASQAVAEGLCRELVENHLSGHPRLGFWGYRVGAEAPAGIALGVEILDGAATETLGRVRLLQAGQPDPFCEGDPAGGAGDGGLLERRCWQAVIHQPGEAGDPLADEAPAVFGRGIREQVLDPFLVEIEERLKRKMPLARAVWLEREVDPPTLVAALPWNDFQRLRKSAFQVLCRRSNAPVEIAAVGHSVPASFPPVGTPQIAEAFVVRVSAPASDVVGLTPGVLFLVRYDPPAIETIDDDLFFGGPDDE